MVPTLSQLLRNDALQEVSTDTLKELAHKYPYFGAFQFLLAYRLKQSGEDAFAEQFRRTALYFQNPLWLKAQLTNWDNQAPAPVAAQEDEAVASFAQDTLDEVVTHPEHLPPVEVAAVGEALPPAAASKPVHQADIQKDELPLFQAYHTVDYFASQGIRISTDLLQNDRLGKQLKSFTEWLRTMKKLPPSTLDKQTGSEADPRIAQFAETSLREREVLTEAMAEVLVKQGKTQQAVDTYRKLSLLNPQKSAYFAARIEALKAV